MRKNKKTIKLSKQCRLIIEKDNKFKSMGVEVIFFGKFDYKKITIYSVLSRILANSNKMYPTMQLMNQRKEELYDATLDIVYKYWYQMAVLKFVGNFVNPKYVTSKTYEEDIFAFLAETIFNPNIQNHAFDNDLFNISKSYVYNEILLQKDQPSAYAMIALLKLLGNKKQAIAASVFGDKKVLNELTPSNLVDYYNELVQSPFDIYVYGDVQFSKIVRMIKKYFCFEPTRQRKKYLPSKAILPFQIASKKIYKDVSQAKLAIAYTTGIVFNDKNCYAMRVLNNLLGENQQSKLFIELREKQGLCYSIFSHFDSVYGMIYIYTGIPMNQVDKVIEEIDKQIQAIQNGEFSSLDMDRAKIDIISTLKKMKDNMFEYLNYEFRYSLYNENINLDEIINKYQEVTKKDIIHVAKKIQYKTHVVVTKKD